MVKKRDHIISKVKSRSKKKNSKYDITIPTLVADAIQLDKENENLYWRDVIRDKMANIRVAFDVLDE